MDQSLSTCWTRNSRSQNQNMSRQNLKKIQKRATSQENVYGNMRPKETITQCGQFCDVCGTYLLEENQNNQTRICSRDESKKKIDKYNLEVEQNENERQSRKIAESKKRIEAAKRESEKIIQAKKLEIAKKMQEHTKKKIQRMLMREIEFMKFKQNKIKEVQKFFQKKKQEIVKNTQQIIANLDKKSIQKINDSTKLAIKDLEVKKESLINDLKVTAATQGNKATAKITNEVWAQIDKNRKQHNQQISEVKSEITRNNQQHIQQISKVKSEINRNREQHNLQISEVKSQINRNREQCAKSEQASIIQVDKIKTLIRKDN